MEFTNGMQGKLQIGYIIEAVVDEGHDASLKIVRMLFGGGGRFYRILPLERTRTASFACFLHNSRTAKRLGRTPQQAPYGDHRINCHDASLGAPSRQPRQHHLTHATPSLRASRMGSPSARRLPLWRSAGSMTDARPSSDLGRSQQQAAVRQGQCRSLRPSCRRA